MGFLTTLTLTLGTGLTAQAATYDPEGLIAHTQANVSFTAPEKNPDKPTIPGASGDEKPDTPTDNKGTTSDALLKIVYLSDLKFNTHNVSSENKTYNAKLIDTAAGNKISPYVQISDNRGTGAGWKLNVKQDGEFKTDTGQSLTGAYINFGKASLLGSDGNNVTNPSISSSAAKLSTDGTQVTIIDASRGAGNGITYGQFGSATEGTTDGVQMNVIGGTAIASEYKTSLTWTLSSVPA